MDAIHRVDRNRVVTSPDAAGPCNANMQHGSVPQSLLPAANAECHQTDLMISGLRCWRGRRFGLNISRKNSSLFAGTV
jgi:hypothetical protein